MKRGDIRHEFVYMICILAVLVAVFSVFINNAFNSPAAGSLAPLNVTSMNVSNSTAMELQGQTFFDSLLGISTGSDAVDLVVVGVVGLFIGYIIIGWIRAW